jgi:integrase
MVPGHVTSKPPNGVLRFGTTIGTAMEPNNFVKRELKPALARAGLPNFHWHSFRHFAIGVLIGQGADILTLARIAGHSDPSVTLKVYGHLMRGALRDAAERYEPLVGAGADSSW